jgi:16S rRNA G1207 methylase RsmC
MKEFVNGMGGAQLVGFKKFASSFNFCQYETLIDVGGSGAVLSIEVAKKNPHMKCTSLDLLPVQDIAKANIEENVLTNQVCSMI